MKRHPLLACLLAVCFALVSAQSQALTLGRLRVLSPLGQPLMAEIDIPDITQEEAATLRISLATPEAFKSAGLEYNASVSSINITGKRRADGRAYLELKSSAAVNESFLDLVLDLNWSTGRMVRDYTLLFDPPTGNLASAQAIAPTLPIANSIPTPIAPINAPDSTALGSPPVAISASTAQPVISITARTGGGSVPTISARTAKTTRSAKAARGDGRNLTVKKGDTAVAIALAEKPEGISLDQMLVAMLKANPDAFIGGNINRLKSGVVLDMPSEEEARSLSAREAKSSLQVQSRDFNEYRRNLATNVAATATDSGKREITGKVSAKVEDKKANTTPPDRLTLAKPDAANKPAIEDKIAVERAASDATGRRTELERNIADLAKVSGTTPAIAASSPAAAVVVSTPTPASSEAMLPAPPPPPSPAQADIGKTPASLAPSQVTSAKSDSWISQLISHTLTPWLGGALALVLLIAAWVRTRMRKNGPDTLRSASTQNFEPSEQSTHTVFGAVGAQQVNTQDSGNSTMVYTPSQFAPTSGDVDPIAEADVYLAYNRDVQAEEILKEAKNINPKRTDVYVKLLEIYVKRHDTESFDSTAQDLHLICDGEGAHWARARELAREIRSTSSLFAVSGASFAATDVPAIQSPYANNSLSFTPSVQIQTTPLDAFNINPAVNTPVSPPVSSATAYSPPAASSHLIDFDLSALTLDLPQTAPAAQFAQPALAVFENTKLSLADEYLSIGDKAGARSLIQEVLAQESNPDILDKANQMLSRIG